MLKLLFNHLPTRHWQLSPNSTSSSSFFILFFCVQRRTYLVRRPTASAFLQMEAPGSSCYTCRVMGTTVFVGASAYLLYERTLAQTRGHRALLLLCSFGSLGAAYLRWKA